MKITSWTCLAALGIACFVGCGSSEVAVQEGGNASSTQPTVAMENKNAAQNPSQDRDTYQPATPGVNTPAKNLPVNASSKPEVVVQAFLNALKTGDDGITAGLLTAVARDETAKHNLAVQPPGTPNAKYEVTAAEIDMQDPTLAQVACLWSEVDDQGGQHTDEVIWVLKKEPEGWRVCGMATRVPTRTEPVLFNFENPPEMMQISDEIAREMEKLAQTPPPSKSAAEQPVASEAKLPNAGNKLRNQ